MGKMIKDVKKQLMTNVKLKKRKILVIDDMQINRTMMRAILQKEYEVIEADDGDTGLEALQHDPDFSLVILDLIMPRMDGYQFLTAKQKLPSISPIPTVVMTAQDSLSSESRCLKLGALDFLVKPYNAAIILQRAKNIIGLRENIALRNTLERDVLTGLYNREAFMQQAGAFLRSGQGNKSYWLVIFNLEKFKVVNAVYGHKTGDKLLQHIAACLNKVQAANGIRGVISRITADNFAVCEEVEEQADIFKLVQEVQQQVHQYPLRLNLVLKSGLYRIENAADSVGDMYDRAVLALQSVKNRYDKDMGLYDQRMRQNFMLEQELADEMLPALDNHEFQVYYQGKYDLRTGSLIGAEALSRWQHPRYGLLLPSKFIHVMEKNGIINLLDFYVAEQVCRNLRKWLDEGHKAVPVSVNFSRIDIYKTDIVSKLKDMLAKYQLPIDLLELEFTETAYIQDADQMVKVALQLKQAGFKLEMDDFGSGYSSLNLLGDVPFDVVKLDMHFLKIQQEGKRKGMLSFVVGLVKWLGITLLAEGIETNEEAAFLRSLGCNQGQGFYFSQPLERKTFEEIFAKHREIVIDRVEDDKNALSNLNLNDIWNPSSAFNALFNIYVGALCILEQVGEAVSIVRCNDLFYKGFKKLVHEGGQYFSRDFAEFAVPEDRHLITEALNRIQTTQNEQSLEIRVKNQQHPQMIRWIQIKIKLIYRDESKGIMLASFDDITESKNRELALKSWEQQFIVAVQNAKNMILCYDPADDSVEIYGSPIFDSHTKIPLKQAVDKFNKFYDLNKKAYAQWQAFRNIINNGQESGTKLFDFVTNLDRHYFYEATYHNQYDAEHILLKTMCVFKDITESKTKELELLIASRREALTGLLNRHAFEKSVNNILAAKDMKNYVYAFGMLDMDDFKAINDEKGHLFGDEVLIRVGDILRHCFRDRDLLARMGGDEFAFFICLPKGGMALEALDKRVRRAFLPQQGDDDVKSYIRCSIGIAQLLREDETFDELYVRADKAMYSVKNSN